MTGRISCSRPAEPRSPAGAGAGATSSTPAAVTLRTTRGLGRRILEECEAAARREGFSRLSLVATLPGLPLYLAYGFEALEDVDVTMPDGVTISCVAMAKPID